MHYITAVENFVPLCEQETCEKKVVLDCIAGTPQTILTRENQVIHMTASAMIFNPMRDKVLFAFHNIYQSWAWTGGHADGCTDMLTVALKEATEETGLIHVLPLSEEIISLDILTVNGHFKRGRWVSAHLHISAAYALTADERQVLAFCPEENSAVRWIAIDELARFVSEPIMIPVYEKIIRRTQEL